MYIHVFVHEDLPSMTVEKIILYANLPLLVLGVCAFFFFLAFSTSAHIVNLIYFQGLYNYQSMCRT